MNNLSLFGEEESLAVAAKPVKMVKPKLIRKPDLSPKERLARWQQELDEMAEDWEELHVQFLHHRLHQLADPNTTATVKKEIWAWLEEPLVRGRTEPFSIKTCLGISAQAYLGISAQACLDDRNPEIDVEEFRVCLRRFLRRLDAERLAAAA